MEKDDNFKIKTSKKNLSILASQINDLILKNKVLKNFNKLYKELTDLNRTQLSELMKNTTNNTNNNNNNKFNLQSQIELFKSLINSSAEKIKEHNEQLKKQIKLDKIKYESIINKNLKPNIEKYQNILEKIKEDNFLIKNELIKKDAFLLELTKIRKSLTSYGFLFDENKYTYDADDSLIDDTLTNELEEQQRRLANTLHETNQKANKIIELKKLSHKLKDKDDDFAKNPRKNAISDIPNYHIEKKLSDSLIVSSDRNNDIKKETVNEDDFLFNDFEDFSSDDYDLVSNRNRNVQTEYVLPSLLKNKKNKIFNDKNNSGKKIDKNEGSNVDISNLNNSAIKPIPKLNLKQIEFNKTKIFLKLEDSPINNNLDNSPKFNLNNRKNNSIDLKIEQLKFDIRELQQTIKKNLKIITNFKIFYKWKKMEIIKILELSKENDPGTFFNGIVVTEIK